MLATPDALAAEIFRILSSATVSMKPAGLARIFHALGIVDSRGDPIPIEQITVALEELVAGGQPERLWRRGTVRYRALDSRRGSKGGARQAGSLTPNPPEYLDSKAPLVYS